MSENKFTDKNVIARCVPMSKLQSVIGGKWKILILWYISFYKVQRFGELMRRLDGITQSTLTKQLRELENDGFLHREIYGEIPPKVEYSLTELGESFIPVLQTMMTWSEKYLCPDYVNPYKEIMNEGNSEQLCGNMTRLLPTLLTHTSRQVFMELCMRSW